MRSDLPVAGQVLNMMDDPWHTRIRRLGHSGLTPPMIRRVEDDSARRRRGLLDGVVEPERFRDFVVEIAAELPMQMICILLETDRHWLFEAVEPGIRFPRSQGDRCRG